MPGEIPADLEFLSISELTEYTGTRDAKFSASRVFMPTGDLQPTLPMA
jgi:hypothetical protein